MALRDTTLFAHSESAPVLPDAALGALDLWKRLRGDRLLPHRSDFKPISWRAWLSDISIVELHEGEAGRYFVKLHGGRTQALVGVNLHRRYMEAGLSADAHDIALAPYIECERTRQPTFSTMRPRLYPGVTYALSRLVLPFTDDTPEGGAERVDRFVTWVGACSKPPYDMSTIYESMRPEAGEDDGQRSSLAVLSD